MAATWRAPAAAGLPLLTAYLITAANGNAASAVRYFVVPVALWLIMLHTTARATFGRWSTTSVSDVTGGESSSDNASAMRALTGGAARLGALAVVAALLVPILVPHFPPRYLTDGLGRSRRDPGCGNGRLQRHDRPAQQPGEQRRDADPPVHLDRAGQRSAPVLATSFYSRGEWRVARRE